MSKYDSKRYLGILINNAILILNLHVINGVLNTLTPTPRWYINVLSIMLYVLWIYFCFKNNEKRKRQVTKINVILGVFTVALFCISHITLFSELIQEQGVESVLKSYDGLGMAIYFTICYLQPIILPLPEPITITAGNVVFGTMIGFGLGYLGTILGIITMFTISRVTNDKLNINLINSKNIEKYNNLVQKNETFILILLFIFPILPDEVICIGAGLSPIKFRKFILIAIFSKLITVGLYSASTDIVKDILGLGLIYQLAIVFTITVVVLGFKKIIHHISLMFKRT